MTSSSIDRLLVVEDNRADARLFREMFNEQGPHNTQMKHVECMVDAESYLADHHVDVILLDLGLPDAEGLGAVRRAHTAAPGIPLVVLTGRDDSAMAAQALKEGAQDYLIKGQIETRSLLRALRYAIERKGMEEALFAEKERAEVTLNCIGDGVVCADLSGRVTFLNGAAEQMMGWSSEQAAGLPVVETLRIVEGSGRHSIPDPLKMQPGSKGGVQLPSNCILLRPDGDELPVEASVAPIHDRDGQPAGAVLVFRDVSAARAMAQQLVHTAHHDFLTGLPNRTLLRDRIERAIALAARHQKKVALLFLDLDGFKHVNDSLGHPIGDLLLQSIARRLSGCVRGADTISRQGGDEFVVLLSEMEHSEDAAISARRLLRAVAQAHHVQEHDLHITASIGVSVYPDDGMDTETLIKNADTAMYQAKEHGRQNYRFFKPAMNVRAVERQAIEEGLRRAVDRGQFALHYQPKVDLTTGLITGVEALIRWNHPTRGPVPPAQFIPVAEDCGLIVPIGNWVLREACLQARRWLAAGLPPVIMAVNVSAIEFLHESFLDGVFAILEETGIEPRFLELELTESSMMKHVESTGPILEKLRARGIQLAVDDFGTGYSSLSYLRRFPVDTLKIDQSFVRQITTAPDEPIVRAVISMSRSLGLRVIAEGVETEAELAFLRTHLCDEAQGYYFSRPVAPEQLARLLELGAADAFLALDRPSHGQRSN